MDLGTVAAAVLRTGAPAGQRDERIVISVRLVGSVLDGRTRIADLSPDFAREVQAAAKDAKATLIVPTGPGPARIDLGGRQFVLPAVLRDALFAALQGKTENTDARTPPAATAAAPLPQAKTPLEVPLATQALAALAPGAGTAQASASAANVLAASGALRAARNESQRKPGEAVAFEEPVLDPHAPASTASRLAARVGASGVFFEAHLAQWMRGDRSAIEVQSEAQRLARSLQADPARVEARTVSQLDALHRDAVTLSGPAWTGQPMLLELGRDPQVLPDGAHGGDETTAPVFFARLQLDLPRLGAIEVELRLAGESVAATVHSAAALAQIESALPDFASALSARGLRPVLLQALAPAEAA